MPTVFEYILATLFLISVATSVKLLYDRSKLRERLTDLQKAYSRQQDILEQRELEIARLQAPRPKTRTMWGD